MDDPYAADERQCPRCGEWTDLAECPGGPDCSPLADTGGLADLSVTVWSL